MSSTLQSRTYDHHFVVSPTQAALGTFLGGPVGYVYFIRKNYQAIGDTVSAGRIVKIGVLLILFWATVIALSLLAPKPLSSACDVLSRICPFALVIFARQHAQKQVKSFPVRFDYYSNWRVVGTALLCLCASIACVLPVVFLVVAAADRFE